MKVILISIFLAFFVLTVQVNHIDASSFPRQEITDPYYDDIRGGEMPDGYGFGDLTTITYVSDGETLDVTYFLREPINVNSQVVYAILFDIDSNALTGDGGIDYIFKKTLEDSQWNIKYLSITRQGFISEIFSTVEPFVESDAKNSIRLIPDLNKFGHVENYVSSFVSQITLDNGTVRQDSSHLVIIPMPTFELTIIPSELKLNPGEQQFITVKISTDSDLPYTITPLNEKSEDGITIKSIDKGNFMMENRIINIRAEVQVPPNLDSNFYSIPIAFTPFFDRLELVDKNQVDLDIVKNSLYSTNIPNEKFEVPLNVEFDPIDSNLIIIFGAGIAAIGTFVATKLASRSQYNAQLSKFHFDHLKEHAVKPLLDYFQLWKNNEIGDEIILVKRDDLKNESYISEHVGSRGYETIGDNLNFHLMEDLLDNHYPLINKKWNDAIKLTEDYLKIRTDLFDLIMKKIELELNDFDLQTTDVGYLSDDPEHPAGTYGTIITDTLTKKIFSSLINGISFEQLKFEKNVESRIITIDHERLSKKIILHTKPENIDSNYEDILESVKKIMNHAKILKKTILFKEKFSQLTNLLSELESSLNKINKKIKLKNIRHGFKQTCDYLNENI